MTESVAAAGSFTLGRWPVNRLGYGAMQLAGDNVFGPPRDRDEALRVLRAAVDSGINHIDTAQFYGPAVVNELVRDALHRYPSDLAIVSKVAARRDDRGAVLPYDEPDQLRAALAWLLDLAPNVLLIPGTGTRAHLAENIHAAGVRLDDAARAELAAHFPVVSAG